MKICTANKTSCFCGGECCSVMHYANCVVHTHISSATRIHYIPERNLTKTYLYQFPINLKVHRVIQSSYFTINKTNALLS